MHKLHELSCTICETRQSQTLINDGPTAEARTVWWNRCGQQEHPTVVGRRVYKVALLAKALVEEVDACVWGAAQSNVRPQHFKGRNAHGKEQCFWRHVCVGTVGATCLCVGKGET